VLGHLLAQGDPLSPQSQLALMTMIATFGTALDITLAELSLETFLPADPATASALFARMESTPV